MQLILQQKQKQNSAHWPGITLAFVIGAACVILATFFPMLPTLLFAIILGAILRSFNAIPTQIMKGATYITKPALRTGIVLLGLQLSLDALASLGWRGFLVITTTVIVTFLGTLLAGRLLRVRSQLSLLVATGFSICGASAIAAMSSLLGDDEESESDIAQAIALVTIFGTITLFLLPLAQPISGYSDEQMGLWIGASVHEVAQVVASAATISAVALAVATIAKLSRVILLAPLVAAVNLSKSQNAPARSGSKRPPLVPLFVLGFLAMILVRTFIPLPEIALDASKLLTSMLLATAMFGLGLGVDIRGLVKTGGRGILLGTVSTIVAVSVSFIMIAAVSQ